MGKIKAFTDKDAKKYLNNKKFKEDSEKIKKIKDADIDYSDIPEITKEFWKNTKITYPETKQKISIRLDKDILDWFKSKGKGYQTTINAILRSYIKNKK